MESSRTTCTCDHRLVLHVFVSVCTGTPRDCLVSPGREGASARTSTRSGSRQKENRRRGYAFDLVCWHKLHTLGDFSSAQVELPGFSNDESSGDDSEDNNDDDDGGDDDYHGPPILAGEFQFQSSERAGAVQACVNAPNPYSRSSATVWRERSLLCRRNMFVLARAWRVSALFALAVIAR